MPTDAYDDRVHSTKSKTLDNSTEASHQCLLSITRADYARYRGANVMHRCVRHLTSFIPLGFQKIPLLDGGFRWERFREKFRFGDTNPAVVLDVKSHLVAAYTDLDATGGRSPCHVVKIFRERLELLGLPAVPGDRFAAVSLYSRGARTKDTGQWENFFPVVVDCVIRDTHSCEFVRARIPDSHWKALEIGLSQISKQNQSRAGLFKVNLPDELKAVL